MPRVSIVITTFNRPELLAFTLCSLRVQKYKDYEIVVVDDGVDPKTQKICQALAVDKYIKRTRPTITSYSNPAVPNNIGIRAAKGDIIILQNSECMHAPGQEQIAMLSDCVTDSNAVFPSVEALSWDGAHYMWYIHSVHNPRPFFFCGAIKKSWFDKLRGFDEDYKFYGFDDNCMADRLKLSGVRFDFADSIKVLHQWHPSSYQETDPNNKLNEFLYHNKTKQMNFGEITAVRNLDHEWGIA